MTHSIALKLDQGMLSPTLKQAYISTKGCLPSTYFTISLSLGFIPPPPGIFTGTHSITRSMVSCLPHYFFWNTRNTGIQQTERFQELLMATFSSAKVRRILLTGIFNYSQLKENLLPSSLALYLVNKELPIIHRFQRDQGFRRIEGNQVLKIAINN